MGAATQTRRRKGPEPEVIETGSERALAIVRGFAVQQSRLRRHGLEEAELALSRKQRPPSRGIWRRPGPR